MHSTVVSSTEVFANGRSLTMEEKVKRVKKSPFVSQIYSLVFLSFLVFHDGRPRDLRDVRLFVAGGKWKSTANNSYMSCAE